MLSSGITEPLTQFEKMATKRGLYQPAPKMLVGDKKTRKPLVQGRLVTDTAAVKVQGARLAQGRLENEYELTEDPTIQPVRSVPVLTENASPRLEPSRCLHLSDGEADVSEAPDVGRPKPVMVFDVSHAGDSHHDDAAVDVVVAYEVSPAKVICHTPGKFERSLRVEKSLGYSSSWSGGDEHNWAVKIDRVQNIGGSTPNTKCQRLTEDSSEDLKEVKEAKKKHYFSKQNKSIIEEILKQEMGSSSTDAISLESESSPLSVLRQANTAISGKSHQPEEKSSGTPSSSLPWEPQRADLGQAGHRSSESTKDKKKNVDYPQPNFEDDSDISTDQVPVKDTQKKQDSVSEDTDSETYSLYEYVSPKKPHSEKSGEKKVLTISMKTERGKQQTETCPSVRKKKTRTVSSRYMQSSSNRAGIQSTLPSKNSISEALKSEGFVITSNKPSREKRQRPVESKFGVKPKRSAQGKTSGARRAGDRIVMSLKSSSTETKQPVRVPVMQSFVRGESPQTVLESSEFPSKEQKTSTPTHGLACHSSPDIDASAIHSLSATSMNVTTASILNRDEVLNSLTSEKHPSKAVTSRAGDHTADSAPLQLEFAYARYLQWAFLNSKAKKIFQEQEKEATAQIHGLWQLVEAKREETSRLKKDVMRLKRMGLLYNILDKTEQDLECLASVIPNIQEDYTRLSSALDTTRHQLPTRDIYIPQGEKEQYEEKLEKSLRESEQLLAELSILTGDKIAPLSQYLDSVTAIDRNVTSIYKELQESQKDVSSTQGLTTRLTSLCVQDMQGQ